MKVLIIEDEAPAYRRLSNLLAEGHGDLQIIDVLDSVEQSLKWLGGNAHPDLIFSDIQLADGLSFEIYAQCKVSCPIIFTTAYDAYMLEAFKTNGVGYLLKPIEAADLAQSIQKVQQLAVNNKAIAPDMKGLLAALDHARQPNYRERFLIKLGNRLIPVPVSDVAYFATADGFTELIAKNEKRYLLDHTLDQLEQELDPKIFHRLNRQTICHIESVTSVHPYFNGKMKLVLKPAREADVIVSRDKSKQVREWLGA